MTEMDSLEIDEGTDYVGYRDALELVYANVRHVGVDEISLDLCVGRIVAEAVKAVVDNPLSDVSLKDGFAVESADVANASPQQPVRLRVIGSVFAGSRFEGTVTSGNAVRICSGSPIPRGADAVVSDEFCEEVSPGVYVRANAEPGRNILRAGEEIKKGDVIAGEGEVILPGCLGLMAAAGIHAVRVYSIPRVAVVAVGDEVVAPGGHLNPGQLYASNIATMGAWLASFGIPCKMSVVGDNREAIRRELKALLPQVGAILTSGGAWGSERDMVVGTLDELGWNKAFHHVRMGPGKGIAFGKWEGKPVFCLPGGPASNEMAFLQFALPGVMRMCGRNEHPLQIIPARLTKALRSRHLAWTEFRDARLSCDAEGNYTVEPFRSRSRLQSIANATCLVCIPEGTETLDAGQVVPVQLLVPTLGGTSIIR